MAYWGGNDPAVCFATDEEGTFVIRLPRPLVDKLAVLPTARMQEIAELWTATDAFARIRSSIERAGLVQANLLFLGDLARLARSAASSGKDLLMLAE